MSLARLILATFFLVSSLGMLTAQDYLKAQQGFALDKLPMDQIRSGLLVYEFGRSQQQEKKDGAFVELADLGTPLKITKIISKLDWKYEKNNNAVAIGLLKIEKAGQYEFKSVNYYDRNALYIDGKLICKYRDGEKTVVKTTLPVGYVTIASVGYVEARGSVLVQWIPPGETELSDIPAEQLVHRIVSEEATLEAEQQTKPAVVADAAGFKLRQEISFPPEDPIYSVPSNVALSPDGKLLIANYGHKPLHVWDLQKPQMPTVIPLQLFENGDVSFHGSVLWSPDGKKIAVNVSDHNGNGTVNSSFSILDVSKKNVDKLPRQAAGIADMAWVGSDRLVISTGSFQDFKLISSPVAVWKPSFTVPLPEKSVHSISVTPDGKKIAVAFESSVGIYSSDGKELDKLNLEDHGNSWKVAFSPNGNELAVILSGELLIYDVAGKKTKQLFRLSSPSFGSGGILKWTPEGTKILLSGATTQLLSATTGKVLAETPTSTSGGRVALSDDCRVLAHFLDKKKGVIAIWDVSLGAAEKVEQVAAVESRKNDATTKAVKLEPGALATPEAAFATYRKAFVTGDWATLLAVSDEENQVSQLVNAFVDLGRTAPAEGEELGRRKAIFKKYDVRDLTGNAGQRGLSLSFDDMARIAAIKNRAECLQEIDALLDPKRHAAMRSFLAKLPVGPRTDMPEYTVFECGTIEIRNRVKPLYFGFIKSGDQWLFSPKAANRFERDKEQQESNAKLSAEKKQVEVRLDTPVNAVETYRQAMQSQDWKAAMLALCEDSQYGNLRGVIQGVEYTGFSGIDRAEIKAKQQVRDEIIKKYGIALGSNKDVSRNENLKTAEQRIACYSELMNWLVTHEKSNEQGEALAKQKSELESQSNEANQTVLKYKPVEVKMDDGKKIMRYPTFVAINIDGKWQLDLIAAQKIAYERSKMGDDQRAMNSQSGIRLQAILKPDEAVPENYYTEVSSLEFSPDGRSLVVGSMNRPVCIYDVAQPNKPLKIPLPKHEGQRLPEVAWSPDAKYLAISVNGPDDHHYFGLYSLSAKRMIKETPARSGRLDNLVWVTADRLAMRGNASPKKWVIVQVPAMKALGSIEAEESSLFNPFVPSPDRRMIAFALEKTLSLHDLSGKEIWKDTESQDRLESLAWSPDSKTLAIGTMYNLTLLDVATHEKRVVAKRAEQPYRGLFYTCDGKKLISVHDGIHVYDAATGKHLLSEGKSFGCAALSPDSKLLAVGDSEGNVRLWGLDIGIEAPINPIPVNAPPAVPASKAEPANGTPPAKTADKQPLPVPAGMRLWTSADGMFKIEAEFVQQKQGFVQLKRKDTGALVSIPIAKLSETDQQYLQSLPPR